MPSSSPDHLSEKLLARARAGDSSAVQMLCDRLTPRLRLAAQRKLGKLHEKVHVSDVLQSTFIDIVRSVESLPEGSEQSCVQWSLRVLDNNIRDLARYFTAQRRNRGLEQTLDAEGGVELAARAPSPATEMVHTEELTRLGLALRLLRPDYQRMIRLFLRPDFSHEMAAVTLGRSVGASRVMLARARASLLAKLEEVKV